MTLNEIDLVFAKGTWQPRLRGNTVMGTKAFTGVCSSHRQQPSPHPETRCTLPRQRIKDLQHSSKYVMIRFTTERPLGSPHLKGLDLQGDVFVETIWSGVAGGG